MSLGEWDRFPVLIRYTDKDECVEVCETPNQLPIGKSFKILHTRVRITLSGVKK